MEQIMVAADDLGDPTDPDEGWDIYFQRVKTGPNVFNIEYRLQALKCKKRALNEKEKACEAYRRVEKLNPDSWSMENVVPVRKKLPEGTPSVVLN